jgi:hypothetical protein
VHSFQKVSQPSLLCENTEALTWSCAWKKAWNLVQRLDSNFWVDTLIFINHFTAAHKPFYSCHKPFHSCSKTILQLQQTISKLLKNHFTAAQKPFYSCNKPFHSCSKTISQLPTNDFTAACFPLQMSNHSYKGKKISPGSKCSAVQAYRGTDY